MKDYAERTFDMAIFGRLYNPEMEFTEYADKLRKDILDKTAQYIHASQLAAAAKMAQLVASGLGVVTDDIKKSIMYPIFLQMLDNFKKHGLEAYEASMASIMDIGITADDWELYLHMQFRVPEGQVDDDEEEWEDD